MLKPGAAGSRMRISVVIPVRNEEESVGALLEGLLAQTRTPAEIVVCDNGSTDRTAEIVEGYARRGEPVRLLRERAGLPGRGRNVAAAHASSEWLAFIDAGTRPAPDWLERLAERAEGEPGADAIYGAWEPVTDGFFTECAALAYVPAPGERSPSTASCLLRRAAWERAGRFREDLRSAEDLLFFRELEAAGTRAAFAPEAVVEWELRPTLASTFAKFTAYARSNMRAGLAREWQRGVARLYLLLLALAAGGLFFRPLLLVPPALLVARAARRVWRWHARLPTTLRALELLKLRRLLMVAWINFVIDLAMFWGTFQWFVHDHVGVPEEVDSSQ